MGEVTSDLISTKKPMQSRHAFRKGGKTFPKETPSFNPPFSGGGAAALPGNALAGQKGMSPSIRKTNLVGGRGISCSQKDRRSPGVRTRKPTGFMPAKEGRTWVKDTQCRDALGEKGESPRGKEAYDEKAWCIGRKKIHRPVNT